MSNREAGKTRVKIAEMLEKQIGVFCQPEDIWQNNYPAAKYMDLARWGVDAKYADGRFVSVSSWDRMGDIVKSKIIVVVSKDSLGVEVCSGGSKR
jgi:hypothetical protein